MFGTHHCVSRDPDSRDSLHLESGQNVSNRVKKRKAECRLWGGRALGEMYLLSLLNIDLEKRGFNHTALSTTNSVSLSIFHREREQKGGRGSV